MADFSFTLNGYVQTVNGNKPDDNGNVQVTTEGGVQSVNNKAPDSAGNVDIDAADLGAATSADLTKEVERATKAEQANATAVATAQKTAEAAQTTANTAKSSAEAAQGTADNAETSAGNAARAAAAAQATASNAAAAASTAKSTADAAQTTANSAVSAANAAAKAVMDETTRATTAEQMNATAITNESSRAYNAEQANTLAITAQGAKVSDNSANIAKIGKLLWSGSFTTGSLYVKGLSVYRFIAVVTSGVYMFGGKYYGIGGYGDYGAFTGTMYFYRFEVSGDTIFTSETSKGAIDGVGANLSIVEIYGIF